MLLYMRCCSYSQESERDDIQRLRRSYLHYSVQTRYLILCGLYIAGTPACTDEKWVGPYQSWLAKPMLLARYAG